MDLIAVIVVLAAQGLIIGALARLALPGPDPLTLLQTMAVGLAGSFIGGLILYGLTGGSAPPSFLSGFSVAVVIVYLIRRHRGGGLQSPGEHAPREAGPYER